MRQAKWFLGLGLLACWLSPLAQAQSPSLFMIERRGPDGSGSPGGGREPLADAREELPGEDPGAYWGEDSALLEEVLRAPPTTRPSPGSLSAPLRGATPPGPSSRVGSAGAAPDIDALVSLYELDSPTPAAGPSTIDLSTLDLSGFDLPVTITPEVQRWLEFYAEDGHRFFGRWLERSARYVPSIEEAFQAAGLPRELAYLPLIESGFSCQVTSPMRAAGMWQIMPQTASNFGLRMNKWVDERRSPEKSTQAAIELLTVLYGRFGDWYLTLAAYNAGEGRIGKALSRSGSTDYWSLARTGILSTETRYYVARFLAAAIIARNPDRFGFGELEYEDVLRFDQIEVGGGTPLARVANRIGVDVDTLNELNPELRKGCTPPEAYLLKLPPGTATLLEAHLVGSEGSDASGAAPKGAGLQHRVAQGQTLGSISKRYGVSIASLRGVNRLGNDHLKAGQTLLVPLKNPVAQDDSDEDEEDDDDDVLAGDFTSDAAPEIHRLRAGETLGRVARLYNVSETSLRRWNGLSANHDPEPDSELVIYDELTQPPTLDPSAYAVPARRFHSVVAGDTLATIASRYGIRVQDLQRSNQRVVSEARLKPGTVLEIPVW